MQMKALQRASTWSHNWFGFWQTEPENDPMLPVVKDFIDPSWNPDDKDRIIAYLTNAPIVVAAATDSEDCLLCSSDQLTSCFQSDGSWLWPEDLAHYVACHGVVLPNRLVFPIRLYHDCLLSNHFHLLAHGEMVADPSS